MWSGASWEETEANASSTEKVQAEGKIRRGPEHPGSEAQLEGSPADHEMCFRSAAVTEASSHLGREVASLVTPRLCVETAWPMGSLSGPCADALCKKKMQKGKEYLKRHSSLLDRKVNRTVLCALGKIAQAES